MGVGGNIILNIIKAIYDGKRGSRIEEKTDSLTVRAATNEEKLQQVHDKTETVEKQTNGNFGKVLEALKDNNSIVEKALLALAATKGVESKREIRATDK